jgi:hypothetical protein
MIVEVVTGDDAYSLINKAGFRKEWLELYDRCPWSTVFQ